MTVSSAVISLSFLAEQKLTTLSGERYGTYIVEAYMCTFASDIHILCMCPVCSAREKVALLIGNQKYVAAGLNRLKCTEEEVRKVAEKLRQFDFKVHVHVMYDAFPFLCCMVFKLHTGCQNIYMYMQCSL